MTFQAGVVSKWTNDSQRLLLEHFDIIQNSPSHIYHSALPLSPSTSWLRECYSVELSLMVKMVKGLPTEWGMCSRTVLLNSFPKSLSCHNNIIAVGLESGDIIILSAITGIQTAVLSGHKDMVVSLVFSLNGTSLVSGSWDHTVKLWDVQTGGIVKTFSGHSDWVKSVSISADCTRIASGSYDKTICLWDIQTGECHYTIQQQYHVLHVCFSPTDPQNLLSISDGKVWQWDINGHQNKPPFDGTCIAFSSDGTQFVSCYNGVVTIQNSDSGEIVAKLQVADEAYSQCFSLDDGLMGSAMDSTGYIWNITNSGPHIIGTVVGHTKEITSLTFSSPSSLITTSKDKSVKVWQIGALSTDSVVTDLNPTSIASAPIQSMALQAKDGIIITSGSDGVVQTWDIFSGLCRASFQIPAKDIDHRDAQLIDGRLICIWYKNGKIHMWDTEKGELQRIDSKSTSRVRDLKISGDKSKIFLLNINFIQAYSMQTGELVGKVKVGRPPNHKSLIVDGSRVWVHIPNLGYEGWDFGIPGSLPVQLYNILPYILHPSGIISWDASLSRIKDQTTNKVVFQLSRRFTKPIDVQWNGQYLVVCYSLDEVFVLDFGYLLHQ